ncbi:MAG: dicarboxylate/amino acid:cation symporter [Parachlamydiaceae bacterium]|nr:dicarboxylate/amino acid:cation symporter [Parachlamydiaceae bacterium]
MNKKRPWSVFIAIALAVVVGMWVGTDKTIFGVTYYSIFDLIGSLFVRALTLIVVPLVSSSIITGIARIAGDSSFGRLGFKTFAFYVVTSLIAILIGLFFVNAIGPGFSQSMDLEQIGHVDESIIHKGTSLTSILLDIVPSNIIEVFQGKMLALIFFSLIFGYCMSRIEPDPSSVLMNFWKGIFQSMLKFTHLIMKVLPLGVFCLVAKVFATTGTTSLTSVALFTITVLCGFLIFVFIGLPLLLKLYGGINPLLHFRAMGPALITAFSTSSSSATLPITMDCVEKRVGVSNRLTSLIIPLGTSINLSGSALYECVAALFVAQAYGIDISIATQFQVVVLSLITSMGVAGIPGGSLVAIILILKSIGLPAEGIGIFLAVDRLLDMCRTTVNVFSDSVCAALVAVSEGETILTHPSREL